MKIKTILFNFATFSILLAPIIHAAAALPPKDPQPLLKATQSGNFKNSLQDYLVR